MYQIYNRDDIIKKKNNGRRLYYFTVLKEFKHN